MIDQVKEMQEKFALAEAVLGGMSDGLHHLAGRPNLGEDITQELQMKAKRVKI
jgi:hypothetical protein